MWLRGKQTTTLVFVLLTVQAASLLLDDEGGSSTWVGPGRYRFDTSLELTTQAVVCGDKTGWIFSRLTLFSSMATQAN